MLPLNYIVNANGIPCIGSIAVNVGATQVSFTLNSRLSFSRFRGLVLVELSQTIPSDATQTLPIVVTSANGTVPLVKAGGEEVTVADFAGAGVYLLHYSNVANTLQVLPAIV